ncbi:MAG: MerR family transcriptional regulator [Sphaerochaetaceae bacterium]|nr:MerR family transcriptional regulator [Sphaerochaetaceae bacterium]
MREYFTVGQLSSIFNINVQTLHYYDSIGLLSPSKRDATTGRRLYKFDQVYKLTTIKYQQKLGKSLKQIREYLDSTDINDTLSDLEAQSTIVHERIQELLNVEKIINEKVSFIRQKFEEMGKADPDSIEITHYEERPFISAEGEEFQFGNDYFYVYPTVVFHEGDRKYFGVYVPEGFKEEHPLAELDHIPAGDYYCTYHLGTYETIFDTFAHVREIAAQNGHTLAERTVSFNIIDQFVEPDCTKYLTQVQIRIV